MRGARVVTLGITLGVVAAACGGGDVARTCAVDEAIADGGPLRVVATIDPIADLVRQLSAGTPTVVETVVPPGRDSHTFEPTTGTARTLAEADVLVANGLDLELPTIELARANMRSGGAICEVGDAAVTPADFLYDRSYPESAGSPNPHVWLSPVRTADYGVVIRDLLVAADPDHAREYRDAHEAFRASVDDLDEWVRERTSELPPERRVLVTYHDAYAYFGADYGWRVIGAVQPSSFDEPSPRDVADLIEQLRDEGVTAVFGSEVYPSPVLDRIAAEAGADYVDDLRDDVLPGDPGDPEHSWQGLVRENVDTIVDALQP